MVLTWRLTLSQAFQRSPTSFDACICSCGGVFLYLLWCALSSPGRSKNLICDDDPISIGLDFASGLAPEQLVLPDEELAESLYAVVSQSSAANLPAPPGAAAAGGQLKKKRVVFEENKLIKRKFKPAPSTQAEMRDCETTLSGALLQMLSFGPKVFNFGKVCVTSKNVKNLGVSNQLEQFCLVNLELDGIDELELTNPKSQMIPGGQMAGFDLTLCCDEVKEFRKQVSFTINKVHRYTFTVSADIIPIHIQPNMEEVVVNFERSNHTFTCAQVVKLTNTVNAPAEFTWSSANPQFAVTPLSGTIDVGKTTSVKVTYRPRGFGPDLITESELTMKIQGGEDQIIPVRATMKPSPCVVNVKDIAYGTVAVGTKNEKTILIRNTGSNYTCFQVVEGPSALKVSPSSGFLEAGDSMELTLTLSPHSPEVVSTNIVWEVRGDKPIKLPITFKALIPDIRLIQDEIDFGDVTAGTSKKLPLVLENHSEIPAILYLDLGTFPGFELIGPPPVVNEGAEEQKEEVPPPIARVSSAVAQRNTKGLAAILMAAAALAAEQTASGTAGQYMPSSSSKGPSGDGSMNSARSHSSATSQTSEAVDEDESAYMITVPAKGALACELLFAPLGTSEYTTEFPLYLSGVPTYAPLRRLLHAVATPARVTVNPLSMDFKKRVVLKKDGAGPGYTMKISMKNEEDKVIQWSLTPGAPEAYSKVVDAGVRALLPDTEINVCMGNDRSDSPSDDSDEPPTTAAKHNTWKIDPVSGYETTGGLQGAREERERERDRNKKPKIRMVSIVLYSNPSTILWLLIDGVFIFSVVLLGSCAMFVFLPSLQILTTTRVHGVHYLVCARRTLRIRLPVELVPRWQRRRSVHDAKRHWRRCPSLAGI
jgi:hypothetical protein